jgi:ADP-ribosylation factor protein 6
MGGSISKMMAKIFGSKEMRLLMLGLDAAGKTSEIHPPFCLQPVRNVLTRRAKQPSSTNSSWTKM